MFSCDISKRPTSICFPSSTYLPQAHSWGWCEGAAGIVCVSRCSCFKLQTIGWLVWWVVARLQKIAFERMVDGDGGRCLCVKYNLCNYVLKVWDVNEQLQLCDLPDGSLSLSISSSNIDPGLLNKFFKWCNSFFWPTIIPTAFPMVMVMVAGTIAVRCAQ